MLLDNELPELFRISRRLFQCLGLAGPWMVERANMHQNCFFKQDCILHAVLSAAPAHATCVWRYYIELNIDTQFFETIFIYMCVCKLIGKCKQINE